jgi:aspartate/methionine/tyrosine aminotransferase
MPMEEEAPEAFGYERIRANLAESSMTDLTLAEVGVRLDELVLLYGDHRGHEGARALIAGDGAALAADDVLLTAGAAMALFVVHTSLLGPGDHLVVARPNYATNLETPYAIGCDVDALELTFEEGYRVDVDRIARRLRPNTRLVSLTTPHNPTGVELDLNTLLAVIRLCERHGCRLLLDQTYRDMAPQGPLPLAAGLSDRAITVSSVSKTFGVPGIREGWIVCADRALMNTFLAAKEQIVLTGSMIDEAIAFEVLRQRPARLPGILARAAAGQKTVAAWIASEPAIEWVLPTGGVTALPRVRRDAGVDMDAFYRRLVDQHGVYVGPGRWFGLAPESFRIGWGWPSPEALAWGLGAISESLAACRR